MAKIIVQNLLHKFIPDLDVIKQHKNLQFLGDRLHQPYLWHLSRRSVSRAFAIGLFCAWIPSPMQMAMSAFLALYFRAHIPISVALVWVTNPLTMPPLFYFSYWVGQKFLNTPPTVFSLGAVLSGEILLPFVTGCLIVGVLCSAAGYFWINYFWRYHAEKKWSARKHNRKLRAANRNPFRSKYY